jgi:hypothetical protein
MKISGQLQPVSPEMENSLSIATAFSIATALSIATSFS